MMNTAKSLLMAAACCAALVSAVPAWAQTAAAPASAASAPVEYRLGAGDTIRILVYQNPDLTLEARISESGLISYPLIGSIKLGGLSTSQAEAAIAEGLRKGNFVKQPQVTLVVLQVRGNQASVLGLVNRPGRVPLESGEMRLTDVLATAGGVLQTGSDVIVVVGTRNGKPFRAEIDLPTVFAPERRGEDILVQNNDVIWVDRAPIVYIYGEVQRPGALRLDRSMTVIQALAAGGGLTLRGTEKGLRVHRKGADGKLQVLTPTMDDTLRDGDVVFVRESLF